jgi:hypothetical protein
MKSLDGTFPLLPDFLRTNPGEHADSAMSHIFDVSSIPNLGVEQGAT